MLDNNFGNSTVGCMAGSEIDVMEGGKYMNDSAWIWPSSDMNFWKIDNDATSVTIKWSHNCFEDYKTLAYQFYECGYKTFEEVYEKANEVMKQRGKEKGNGENTQRYQNRYGFSGKIRCGECGGVFKRRIHYKPSGNYVAWCCTNHITDKSSCSMKYITDDGVSKVLSGISRVLVSHC